ncbi:MAG: ABC transporter ATP-binding protein [Oscillospiraceae bacterium]|nr:ABC transporter ATP-binding protein [Oscillospiraceae bacterium]
MIEIKNIYKQFDDNFLALKDFSLQIEKGSAFGLLGSNGAGKSTLLRLLSGVYKQDAGEIIVDGESVYDNPAIKQKIFFINDETIQFGNYTLEKLKDLYKGLYPNFSDELFERLNNKIKLPTYKKLNQFSKGMKRQAIVIIGLSCQTEYLLLDEAFDGIDPAMRIIVKRMLVDAMIDRELTVIISSHNLKEISEICDSIAFIHKGELLFAKSIESVKNEMHKLQVAFSEEISEDALAGLNIIKSDRNQSVRHYIIRGNADEIRAKFESLNPIILDIVQLTLEEIFIIEMEERGYGNDAV